MKRRNMEVRTTPFSKEIMDGCSIHDLQGLCTNRNGEFTIGVEAIDMQEDSVNAFIQEMPQDEIYIRACFCEKFGAVFTLLLHKQMGGQDYVYIKQYRPDHAAKRPVCIYDKRLSEDYFLNWWRARKYGGQKKRYRPDMQHEIDNSYFDQLFENNGSSWSANIDGYVVRRTADGDVEFAAMVENRYSKENRLQYYDPAAFFRSNGGDYKPWKFLKGLADTLQVPLFLFTYARKPGDERKVGLACVESVSEEGITSRGGLSPKNNIKGSVAEALQWMEGNA